MGQPRGPQNYTDQYLASLNQPAQPAPPGAPPLPLPPAGPVQATPPPDYKTLGTDQAKADLAGAVAGGGWTFDPDQMNTFINNLQDRLDGDLTGMKTHMEHVTGIDAPGTR